MEHPVHRQWPWLAATLHPNPSASPVLRVAVLNMRFRLPAFIITLSVSSTVLLVACGGTDSSGAEDELVARYPMNGLDYRLRVSGTATPEDAAALDEWIIDVSATGDYRIRTRDADSTSETIVGGGSSYYRECNVIAVCDDWLTLPDTPAYRWLIAPSLAARPQLYAAAANVAKLSPTSNGSGEIPFAGQFDVLAALRVADPELFEFQPDDPALLSDAMIPIQITGVHRWASDLAINGLQ